MFHNPNISQSLDRLPTFNADAVDKVLADTNEKMSDSISALDAILRDRNVDIVDKCIALVKDTCDSLVTAGFGTGIAIVSGVPSSNPEIQKLDTMMKESIKYEENIRARVLGIKRINPDTQQVDVRAEVPNWAKTVGATLPSWSDPASKQNLAVMICDQIKKNLQEIAAYRKDPVASPEKMAHLCSALLHTEFLIGVMEALAYAKPADFRAMTASYPRKDGASMTILEFFRAIKAAVEKADITGLIAVAVARK